MRSWMKELQYLDEREIFTFFSTPTLLLRSIQKWHKVVKGELGIYWRYIADIVTLSLFIFVYRIRKKCAYSGCSTILWCKWFHYMCFLSVPHTLSLSLSQFHPFSPPSALLYTFYKLLRLTLIMQYLSVILCLSHRPEFQIIVGCLIWFEVYFRRV